jgi:hypothetical protein
MQKKQQHVPILILCRLKLFFQIAAFPIYSEVPLLIIDKSNGMLGIPKVFKGGKADSNDGYYRVLVTKLRFIANVVA